MSNKTQSQKERPNTANPAHSSKIQNQKEGSENPKQRDKLQASQEEQSDQDAGKIITGQSDYDVNGNELETNLRNSPAH